MSDSTSSVAVSPDVFKEKMDELVSIAGELSQDAHGSPVMLSQSASLLRTVSALVGESDAEWVWQNGSSPSCESRAAWANLRPPCSYASARESLRPGSSLT